jgi:16S rRNA (uracil1498-N3)-methyltransferase
MTRVLVDGVAEGPRILRNEVHHHLARVLRVRVGAEITLFDGTGREAEARVTRMWPTEILVQVGAVRSAGKTPLAITLIACLMKGEKMDWVVQKATELGCGRIVPAASAHAVVKLDAARAAERVKRWQKIAAEAAAQCGRADVPEITEIRDIAGALATGPGWRVLLDERARGVSLRQVLPSERPAEVTVAVGPEGGFAAEEVTIAERAGYVVCGLGPRILRAETAALVALAAIGYALGDLA